MYARAMPKFKIIDIGSSGINLLEMPVIESPANEVVSTYHVLSPSTYHCT